MISLLSIKNNIKHNLLSYLSKDFDTRISPAYANSTEYSSGRIFQPRNYKAQLNAYSSWVYICSNLNAINVALTPFKVIALKSTTNKIKNFHSIPVSKSTINEIKSRPYLKQRVSKAVEVVELTEHPFIDLMHNVNEFSNQFDFTENSQLHQELTGNCYWYVVSNNLGVPEQLWLLPVDRIEVIPDRQTFIAGYRLQDLDGNWIPLEESEVIHFKFANPNDPYYGMAPLVGSQLAVTQSNQGLVYGNDLLRNNATPAGFLTPKDKPLGKLQFDTWNDKFTKKYGIAGKRGKIALLTQEMDFIKSSYSPSDLDIVDQRKFSRDEIANSYNVPISMLTQDANRANAFIGDIQYQRNGIKPRLTRNEQKINEKLMPRYADNVFMIYDNNIPQDRELEMKEDDTALKNGSVTINEVRRKRSMDEVEWGETPWIPFNLVQPGSVDEVQNNNDDKSLSKSYTDNQKEVLWKRRDQDALEYERVLLAAFRKVFDKWLKTIIGQVNQIQEVKTITKLSGDDAGTVSLQITLALDQAKRIIDPIQRNLINEIVRRFMKEQRVSPVTLAGQTVNAIIRSRQTALETVISNTNKDLQRVFKEALLNDLDLDQLKSTLRGKFDQWSVGRVQTIARTESTSILNRTEIASMDAIGIQSKMWLTQRDAKVRDAHAESDGQTVRTNESFDVGGESLNYPGDPNGSPENVINCRCFIVPIKEE